MVDIWSLSGIAGANGKSRMSVSRGVSKFGG